jgi:membrane-bound lytic murein transglycosylase D
VAQWNKVGSNARFKPGQSIVVYSAAPPVVAKSSTPAKPRAATRAKAPTRTASAKGTNTVAKAGSGKGRSNVVASAAP